MRWRRREQRHQEYRDDEWEKAAEGAHRATIQKDERARRIFLSPRMRAARALRSWQAQVHS